jgi:hypothetical protein
MNALKGGDVVAPDRTSDHSGDRAILALGLRPVGVEPVELARASCRQCRAEVWHHEHQVVTLDLEVFRGNHLLSLHPCCHEWSAEDFDDPDWGYLLRTRSETKARERSKRPTDR